MLAAFYFIIGFTLILMAGMQAAFSTVPARTQKYLDKARELNELNS